VELVFKLVFKPVFKLVFELVFDVVCWAIMRMNARTLVAVGCRLVRLCHCRQVTYAISAVFLDMLAVIVH
jgi:hypothetical protein